MCRKGRGEEAKGSLGKKANLSPLRKVLYLLLSLLPSFQSSKNRLISRAETDWRVGHSEKGSESFSFLLLPPPPIPTSYPAKLHPQPRISLKE
jgi:hypothetical protein